MGIEGQPTQPANAERLAHASAQPERSAEPLSLVGLTAGQTTEQKVAVDGEERRFAVHVPKGWDGKSALPTLFYFNGLHPGSDEKESFTGLSQKADEQGFAVVYMKGTGFARIYNTGNKWFDNGHNENKYLNAVHTKLASELPLDNGHQGLAGFSEGGSIALQLAQKNDWVSSTQAVEGYLTGKEGNFTRPVSEQSIHAAHDSIVPLGGTQQVCEQANREAQTYLQSLQYGAEPYLDLQGTLHGLTCMAEQSGNFIESQHDVLEKYKQANGITAQPSTTHEGDATTYSFTNPQLGTEVRQVILASGTHAWAGSNDHSGDIPHFGKPDLNYSATASVAQFFLTHPLKPNK